MLLKEEIEVQLQLPSWKAKFTHQIGSLSLLQQSFGVRAGDSQHANLQMYSDTTGQWYMPLKTQNLPRADSIPDTDFIRRDSKSQWNTQPGNTPPGRLPVVLSVMCFRSHGESQSLTHIMGEMNSRPSRATLFLNLLPAGDTQTYISNVFLHPSLDLRFQQDSSWVSLSSAHQPVLDHLSFLNFW